MTSTFMKGITTIAFFFLGLMLLQAQPPESGEQYMKEYNRRIQQEYINDIYIPEDLTDAFKEIKRLSNDEALLRFQRANEDTVAQKLYFSLGRWIVVNWGFHGGSRLSHWLKTNVGVSHPEDQAMFIIRTFHRSLNKEKLEVKELAQELNESRAEKRVANKKIIKKETRKVPRKPDE